MVTSLYEKGVRLLLRRVETTDRSQEKAGFRNVKDTAAAVKTPSKRHRSALDEKVEALMVVLRQTGHLLHVKGVLGEDGTRQQTRDFAAGVVKDMLEDEGIDLAGLSRTAAVDAWEDLLRAVVINAFNFQDTRYGFRAQCFQSIQKRGSGCGAIHGPLDHDRRRQTS